MSALGRFFANLFGRRRRRSAAYERAPFTFGPADPPFTALEPEPLSTPASSFEPGPEPVVLAAEPALGAAAVQANTVVAWERAEIAGAEPQAAPPELAEPNLGEPGSAPELDDEEERFEEEERAEGDEEAAAGVDLDDKIAAREAAVPYLRHLAEEEALKGEHRVAPTDPSGPDTLAEALARLEGEGRLTCELGEDAQGAPCLVYRPLPTVH